MSSVSKISAVLFASAVLATPYAPAAYGHGHAHGYAHKHLHSSAQPYPYPVANSTTCWGSTGLATGASPYTSAPAPSYAAPAPSYSASAPSYSAPAQPESYGTVTYTSTNTQYATVYQTLSSAYPVSSAGAGGYGSGSGSACPKDVTVTTTEKVYVTVSAGGVPAPQSYGSSSAPSAPSAPAYSAPVSSSSAPAYSAPSYSAPASSSSQAAPKSYPGSVAVSYGSSATPSSSAIPAFSAYTAAGKQAVASSTASAVASQSSSSTSSGKRGLAYNTASLTTCFDDSKEITWAYNWVSASGGLTGNLNYIPTLHDGSDTFTGVWATEASAAIAAGSKTLFSFNEPDESSQANMSPEAAAQAYIKYMNPFAGKAQLCAPSVTNGQGDMGLTWLQNFLTACGGQCHIDCYNIHWYNIADSENFKQQVSSAIQIAGEKPVYVSEFQCTGASDDEVNSFLDDVMPWMDSNDSVAGYAYYMVADGLLLSGTEPSTYGSTYMSSTG